MRRSYRLAIVMGIVVGLALSARGQEKTEAPNAAALTKALNNAMTPGEGQKKLDFMVGRFDIKVRTWVDPRKPPFESTATAVGTWVLGNRYVQQMVAGDINGQLWSGIGYAGFDTVSKKYVATFMDSGSTGMEWFSGTMDADGKLAKLTATIHDEVTGKPITAEMRLSIATNGDHVTELWQGDPSGNMSKVMELQYARRKS